MTFLRGKAAEFLQAVQESRPLSIDILLQFQEVIVAHRGLARIAQKMVNFLSDGRCGRLWVFILVFLVSIIIATGLLSAASL